MIQVMLFGVLYDGFVADLVGLVPAHLSRSCGPAFSATAALSVGAILEN